MPRMRMPRLRTLSVGSLSILVVGWLGWKAAHWLPLPSGALYVWLVRSVVWMVGLFIIFLILRLISGGSREPEPEPDAVDTLLDEARQRLRAAGKGGRNALRNLPAVLVLGPRGSAKTTLVQRSDLGTEHLVGDAPSAGVPSPTDAVNVWYHEDHLLVEAGGSVTEDAARWKRVLDRLRPRKWIPALLGRPQAPRVALVCFDLSALADPGSADAAVAAAGRLRARLTEMSESMGIRLPVYVVFTKTDTVPHFEAFVEHLRDAETRRVLGATLRARSDVPAGSYREHEASRLKAAFDEIFLGLAEARLDLLSRPGSTERSGAAYEFPREFRKITDRATDFLLELCRPSQLQLSPFLRGFYFTGVRPVVVVEGAEAPRSEPSPAASSGGATELLDLRRIQEAAPPTPREGRSRRVPQWVFLGGILPRAVLADRVAMGITTGGFGLTVLRRIALAAGIAAVLGVGVLTLLGFGAERDLQEEAAAALEGAQGLRSPDPALASTDDLERLDDLRTVAARLSHYENHDRPARALLGMYTGDDLHSPVRATYFDRFRPVLLERANDRVVATLDALPEEPSLDEYDAVYDALKLYVESTEHPEEADSIFFGRELTEHWVGASDPSEEQRELARAQFAFYGGELPHGNPYDREPDNLRVAAARDFLVRHTDIESFYRSLLAQWERLPDVDFNRDAPGTERFVRNPAVVPGAFTRAGWDSVQANLSSTDQVFNLDRHVVGDRFFVTLSERGFDPEALAPRIRSRYEADYIRTWTDFLIEADVGQPSLTAAEDWLSELGSRESAIFLMMDVVDENTRTGAPALDTAFRPVRMITGPDSLNQLFSDEWGAPYLSNLRALGQAAGGWIGNTSDPRATDDFGGAASEGRGFVQDLEVEFPTEPPEARTVGNAVARILSEPFEWATGVAAQGEALAANQLAQAFCSDQRRVFGAYPFRRDAPDADLGDVHALLQPDEGELYIFLEEAESTGSRLNSAYESFSRQAERVSRSFYGRGSDSPAFRIQFRVVSFAGIDRVELNVDGRRGVFTPTRQEIETFEWDGERAEEVTLVVDTGDGEIGREYHGTWSLFEFFHQADWRGLGTGRHEVSWRLDGGVQLTGEVRFAGERLLDPDYLSTLGCPTRIAR